MSYDLKDSFKSNGSDISLGCNRQTVSPGGSRNFSGNQTVTLELPSGKSWPSYGFYVKYPSNPTGYSVEANSNCSQNGSPIVADPYLVQKFTVDDTGMLTCAFKLTVPTSQEQHQHGMPPDANDTKTVEVGPNDQ